MHYKFRKGLQLIAAFCLMFGIHLDTIAQAIDVEPNNECLASQSVGAITPPFVVNGSLDTPPEFPDVDFFQFNAAPGLDLVAELKDAATDVRTLDPMLGLFDSSCNQLSVNDDHFTLDSHIDFTVPSDGTFILGASSYPDGSFSGTGNSAGTYELTILVPPPSIGSISIRVVDALTGDPLPGDVPPFAFAELAHCDDNGCNESVNVQNTDTDGRVVFENDSFGGRLAAGTYQVTASANEYQSAATQPFAVAENEDFDAGDIALTPPPIEISDVEICDALLPQGGTCRYSVTISNNTRERLRGLAWSLVDGFGLGSTTGLTLFEASARGGSNVAPRQRVNLRPLRSAVLPFQFDVPSFARDGATFCTYIFFGLEPSPLINTVKFISPFCIVKGATGFRVMSAAETQKVIETRGGNTRSSLKVRKHNPKQNTD